MNTSPLSDPGFARADCIGPDHPQRAEVEAFIRSVYRQRFSAHLPQLMPHLLAFRDADGSLSAAVGLRCAFEGPLFVERYLGERVEQRLGQQLGIAPARSEIVEIGNFAAHSAGAARALILALIPLLRGAGLRWTLFVATRQLRNAFQRLGLEPRFLCAASAQALGEEGEAWGSYYEAAPEVLFGDLRSVHAVPSAASTRAPRTDVTAAQARGLLSCGAPA